MFKYKKLHPEAQIDFPKLNGDVGYDIHTIESKWIWPLFPRMIKTGIAFELPERVFANIKTRSGHGVKNNLRIHPGTIDTGYRGEVGVKVYNLGWMPYKVLKGEKIAQAVLQEALILPLKEVQEVTPTQRGVSGFGSTGRK